MAFKIIVTIIINIMDKLDSLRVNISEDDSTIPLSRYSTDWMSSTIKSPTDEFP